MADQKEDPKGGSGHYLTKDEFWRFKDEYRLDQLDLKDRMDAQTKEIVQQINKRFADQNGRIEKSWEDGRAHCDKSDDRLEKRIEKLETSRTYERLLAGGVAFGTSILTAIASWFALMRGG